MRMPTFAAHGEPSRKRVSGMCSATRGLEPCTIPEEAPSMHCPGS